MPVQTHIDVPFTAPVLVHSRSGDCEDAMIPSAIRSFLPISGCVHFEALDTLVFSIPVGDSDMESVVTKVTFLVSWIGVFAVLMALLFRSYPTNVRKTKKDQ